MEGLKAIPTNVGMKGMLDLLPDSDVEIPTLGQMKGSRKASVKCKGHPSKECSHVCMTCKVGLCSKCITSLPKGPHAKHELQEFDDAMDDLEKKSKAEAARYEQINEKKEHLTSDANNNLEAWKTSLEKAVADRASEAVAKVQQWRQDMQKQIEGLFDEGRKQVSQFVMGVGEVEKGSPISDVLAQLLGTLSLEAWKDMDGVRISIDKLEKSLKVYSASRLFPQEALTDKWTVDLGEIKHIGMLSHLSTQTTGPGKSETDT
jgi:gas vesicle protein